MNLAEYQTEALKTAMPTALNLDYLLPGLIAELGECYGKVAKARRDEWSNHKLNTELVSEWGDVAWFVAVALNLSGIDDDPAVMNFHTDRLGFMGYLLAIIPPTRGDSDETDRARGLKKAWRILRDGSEMVTGQPFDVVLDANLAKLKDRANRGKIGGSGDAR